MKILSDVVHGIHDELDSLKARFAQKGLGAPGVAIIDPVVTEYVRTCCWSLEKDIDELKRSSMRYRGVYDPDTVYPIGSVVTRAEAGGSPKTASRRARCPATRTRTGSFASKATGGRS